MRRLDLTIRIIHDGNIEGEAELKEELLEAIGSGVLFDGHVIIDHGIQSSSSEPVIRCNMCSNWCSKNKAHLHHSQYIGDECCWDERLRSTE